VPDFRIGLVGLKMEEDMTWVNVDDGLQLGTIGYLAAIED
jgi:hypothetical protein